MSVSTTEVAGRLHPEDGGEETTTATTATSTSPSDKYSNNNNYYNSVSEIEEEIEEESSSELFEIDHGRAKMMESIREEKVLDDQVSLFSVDVTDIHDNCVYVGVGKSESSVDALSWTLNNVVKDQDHSTLVYLIHIFPEVHYIPSPLGKLPKSQVSPEQVENYMAQERGKRRELLHKFLNMCPASKVKVDTILIESDMVAKAMLDLIPILNIKKLVLGSSKSTIRKLRSKRGGSGIADQILQNAPDYCEVKIICNGKEAMIEQMTGFPSPIQLKDASPPTNYDSFACICFKSPKAL